MKFRIAASVCALALFAAADSAPIGVFDSGLGGLTVLERLLEIDRVDNATGKPGADGVPDFARESFQYFGDQANMPYGDYPAAGKGDFLRELVVDDARFLLGTNYWTSARAAAPDGRKARAKIIVIACNTATAWGLATVRERLAREGDGTQVVGVIEAGVRAALDLVEARPGSKPFAVGVLATPGTISSGAYERTLRAELAARKVSVRVDVVNQGCAGLADAVETASPNADAIASSNLVALVARHRASGFSAPIRAVVLGCTHYPFVLGALEKTAAELRRAGAPLADDFKFVDPAVYTAAECWKLLRDSGRLSRAERPAPSAAFLSVANPALPPSRLVPDGGFTREFKYGRALGEREGTVKRIPFTHDNFGPTYFESVARLLPRTAAMLEAQTKGAR